MLVTLLIYSLWCFSAFFLINHSELFAMERAWLFARLPFAVRYILECAFCFTAWLSLILWWFNYAPGYLVFASAPLVMLTNCTFLKLRGQ